MTNSITYYLLCVESVVLKTQFKTPHHDQRTRFKQNVKKELTKTTKEKKAERR